VKKENTNYPSGSGNSLEISTHNKTTFTRLLGEQETQFTPIPFQWKNIAELKNRPLGSRAGKYKQSKTAVTTFAKNLTLLVINRFHRNIGQRRRTTNMQKHQQQKRPSSNRCHKNNGNLANQPHKKKKKTT
jgi:hypothetical protein